MTDINVSQIQELTRSFKSLNYPFLEPYEDLNKAILAAAKQGKNSISFDFADGSHPRPEPDGLKTDTNRIYLDEGGMAMCNVFDYPKYLEARGFKVEVREPQHRRGYPARSYYISW